MFLRFTSRTNADGSVVRYVAPAHNRCVDGRIKADVLMSLGRSERVIDLSACSYLPYRTVRHCEQDGDRPTAGPSVVGLSEAEPASGTMHCTVTVQVQQLGAANCCRSVSV